MQTLQESRDRLRYRNRACSGPSAYPRPLTNDLAPAITTLAQELASAQADENRPTFRVGTEGTLHELVPLLRDEIYWRKSDRVFNVLLSECLRRTGPPVPEVPKRRPKWRFRRIFPTRKDLTKDAAKQAVDLAAGCLYILAYAAYSALRDRDHRTGCFWIATSACTRAHNSKGDFT